jgi:hypothetical protein
MVNGFNRVREKNVIPGPDLVVDECMSAYTGLQSKHVKHGNPSRICIPRKPESVGVESKTLADGMSGVLIRIDPREELHIQRGKKWEELGSGTGAPLRLMEPWFFTKRRLTGDSAFSSFKLLDELKQRNIYYQGIVKSAHKKFPKLYMMEWATKKAKRGDFIQFSANLPGDRGKVYATCWKDKRDKQVITNCSPLGPGNDVEKKRHRVVTIDGIATTERYDKVVKCPRHVEDIFKYFSVIDVHDHYRQGSLRLEKSWVTKKWWHRMFCTLYGMTITDAFLAARYEHESDPHAKGSSPDFTDFLQVLMHEMINNIFMESNIAQAKAPRHSIDISSVEKVRHLLLYS